MKYQTRRDSVAHNVLVRWTLAAVREVSTIARDAYMELRRLNHGGHGNLSARRSRERTQAFKAELAESYKERSRCC